LQVNDSFAVGVFERGVQDIHDGFQIALITGWNTVTEQPTAYSNLVAQPGSSWGNPNMVDTFEYGLFRYDNGDDLSQTTDPINYNTQGIGGVVFNLSAFGLSGTQTIYGYSIVGYDVTTGGNVANLIDWNNSMYYPTDTTNTTGSGGLDMAALNGLAFEMLPVPEPGTFGLFGVGALLFMVQNRRKRR
jgi:hypothetical protein